MRSVHHGLKGLRKQVFNRLGRQSFFYDPEPQNGIKGYDGEGPVIVMGYRPSTDPWMPNGSSRRLLYDTMKHNGVGDAYLTDCIKERSPVKDDTKNYDLQWNLAVLTKELEIVNPEIIIALGTKAELFLYKHNFAHRYGIVASFHFGIVHHWTRWNSREDAAQAFRDDFREAVACYGRWKAKGWV